MMTTCANCPQELEDWQDYYCEDCSQLFDICAHCGGQPVRLWRLEDIQAGSSRRFTPAVRPTGFCCAGCSSQFYVPIPSLDRARRSFVWWQRHGHPELVPIYAALLKTYPSPVLGPDR
jgi:hypothetical protein